jgi:hypothetical protein
MRDLDQVTEFMADWKNGDELLLLLELSESSLNHVQLSLRVLNLHESHLIHIESPEHFLSSNLSQKRSLNTIRLA